MIIETKDLILAKAKIKDLENIYNNYWSQEETSKFMLWTPCQNLDEAKERLEKIIEFQKTKPLAFFIYEKKSMQAIGMAAMMEISPNVYEDGGIGIGKDFVGKGYGKQILNAFIKHIFENGGEKIICSCHTDNLPSAKMQQACGLKYSHSETVTRKKDNLTYKSDYYSITKSDYLQNI